MGRTGLVNNSKGNIESLARARAAKKPASQSACPNHPDRKARTRGLCGACYCMWRYHNVPGAKVTHQKWAASNPERFRAWQVNNWLKNAYGITVEQFCDLVDRQQRKCANSECGVIFPDDIVAGRRLVHVDHDHATGKVRGLLCPACNIALGQVRDDPERLLGLAEYIESFGQDQCQQ